MCAFMWSRARASDRERQRPSARSFRFFFQPWWIWKFASQLFDFSSLFIFFSISKFISECQCFSVFHWVFELKTKFSGVASLFGIESGSWLQNHYYYYFYVSSSTDDSSSSSSINHNDDGGGDDPIDANYKILQCNRMKLLRINELVRHYQCHKFAFRLRIRAYRESSSQDFDIKTYTHISR